MPDLLENDSINCLNCHWNGKVGDLICKPTSAREEDAIDFMRYPNCSEAIAIRGCTDFILILGNAEIRASES